jgi:hypothetical protein
MRINKKNGKNIVIQMLKDSFNNKKTYTLGNRESLEEVEYLDR